MKVSPRRKAFATAAGILALALCSTHLLARDTSICRNREPAEGICISLARSAATLQHLLRATIIPLVFEDE
jgi:hypothetical protein